MRKKLLVVHPQTRYDQMHLTRDAIIAHVVQYDKSDIFVLRNKDEAFTYLRRSDLTEHCYSSLGEMQHDFVGRILAECAELTIVGHTGKLCHHTAFEEVLKSFVASDAPALAIVLPAEAISKPERDTGESVRLEIQRLAERSVAHGWLPYRLSQYRANLNKQFSNEETATLYMFEEYITSVFFQTIARADASIRFGQKEIGRTSGHTRSVSVTIN